MDCEQTLRIIDKVDKIGIDAVTSTLMLPKDKFGAELSPIQAEIIGSYLRLTKG